MFKALWRVSLALAFMAVSFPAFAQNARPRDDSETGGGFSATNRQADLARLRDFVYPKGFSDQTIVDLENGQVPSDLAVVDYARLHCGETNRFVLNPCMVRYADKAGVGFYVVTQDGNMRFGDLKGATEYFHAKVSDTANQLAGEINVMNAFVDDFCAKVTAGERPGDIIAALGGQHPRISHPIAPANPSSKWQFSNLFSWERCKDCVGIIAVNQPDPPLSPTCGTLRKQSTPHIAYFVVDRDSAKGHKSLDDGIQSFTKLAAVRK